MAEDQQQDSPQGPGAARRAELLAAALAGELTPAEEGELDALSAADPSVRSDLAELRQTAGLLAAAGVTWQDAALPDGLEERILAATQPASVSLPRRPGAGPSHAEQAPQRRRRPLALLAAAAALVAVGAVGSQVVEGRLEAPPSGPPGTLGAVEQIDFTGAPQESRVDASLVAHTWGTETVLEVEGVDLGESFEVVLVSASGAELTSGTFFGTEETVTCRMNAAVLREDVAEVRIERANGSVLATSRVPAVQG